MSPRQDDIPDLVAELRASITAARLRREQRERDNLPCPKCGGDRLRRRRAAAKEVMPNG